MRRLAALGPDCAADLELLHRVTVKYVTLPGWKTSIAKARKWDDLPPNCRAYVEYMEKAIGVRTALIGVGPGRLDMVSR